MGRVRRNAFSAFLAFLPSFLLVLASLGAALDHLFPPDLTRLSSMSTEVLDRHGRPLTLLPAPGGVWRFRAEAAPPMLTNLLIAVEDRRFWWHPGVDPFALVRAAAQLVRSGRSSPAARLLPCRRPACSNRVREQFRPS